MAKKDKLWQKADFDQLKDQVLTKEELRMRHNLRYAAFRVQKELIEGIKCEKEYKDLVKPIEKMEGFDGWENFAETWDIAHPNPIVLVKRMWSIYQEHDQMLERAAIPLPKVKKSKK